MLIAATAPHDSRKCYIRINDIVELVVPDEFHGKTITEIQLRNRYGLNLLAVSKDSEFQINPNPTYRLERGSAMVVIGCNKDISRMPI